VLKYPARVDPDLGYLGRSPTWVDHHDTLKLDERERYIYTHVQQYIYTQIQMYTYIYTHTFVQFQLVMNNQPIFVVERLAGRTTGEFFHRLFHTSLCA
jgi:hypothetical protein